jgi:hypothetical protein
MQNNEGLEMNLQFFAENDVPKQSSASLKCAIKNLSKRIKEHEEYIENPREVIMMANEKLTKEGIKYIIGRLLKNAQEAIGEWDKDKSNLFYDGKALAYYEMLDIIKAELDIREQDLKEFGLDVNLEEKLLA